MGLIAVRRPILRVYGPSGADIVPVLGEALLGVHITDNPGYESDECEIRVAKKAPFSTPPAKGAKYRVEAMWEDNGSRFTGLYEFERAAYSGDPEDGEEVAFICRAGDFRDTLKQTDQEHFDKDDYPTIGDIFSKIASDAGYGLAIDGEIAGLPNDYRLRWNQGRIDFLTEIGDDVGALVKPQAGQLVVTARGSGRTASGKALSPIIIERDPTYSYDVEIEPRNEFREVEARWFDERSGRPSKEVRSTKAEASRLSLPHLLPSKAAAKRAAAAAAQEVGRYVGSGSFEKVGDPDAYAGAPVKCTGFGGAIDETDWIAAGIDHEIHPDEGWITTVSAETKETAV